MPVTLAAAYIIGHLLYERQQRRKAEKYANMVVRHH